MSFGIIEVITLLMGLSGLGVQQNPKAPTAEQALEFAVADADIVAHFDAASVIPGNYKVLTSLQNQPQIKASPELAKAVRKAVAEIDGPRGLVKNMVGVDITTDISDATAFVRIVPKQEPNIVVAVHGTFKADTVDKIAKLTGKPATKDASGAWVDTGDGNAVGLTKGGVLIAGTSSLVKERIASTWTKPSLATGTNLANVAEVINQKPVFAVFLSLSQGARAQVLAEMKGQNFASDVIKRHKFAAFAVFRDGIGWSWLDSTKNGLEAMAQISDGTIEILRAFQIAPRGFAKVMLGALESYRGTNKQVDDLIKRKADVQKLVESFSGDGNFKAQVNKDAAKLKLTVRLTGKTLSEVLPAAGIIPLGVLGFVSGRAESSRIEAPPPSQIVAPPPAPAPKKGNAPPKRP